MSGVCRQEICADMLGLVHSEWELLILLPAPLLPPWVKATLVPAHPAAWSRRSTCLVSLPGIVPPLSPCPQLLSPLANWVLGVGVEVNGDVYSGMLLAQVWSECGSDGD